MIFKPEPLICINCQSLYRAKRNHKSLFCDDCLQAGWKRCYKCKTVFVSDSKRKLCGSHPERSRKIIQPARYDLLEKKTYQKRNKFIILKRDGFQCIYCGKSSIVDGARLHVDHLIPVVHKRGESTADNLITACAECNVSKNDMMLEDSDIARIRTVIRARNKQNGIPDKQVIKGINDR